MHPICSKKTHIYVTQSSKLTVSSCSLINNEETTFEYGRNIKLHATDVRYYWGGVPWPVSFTIISLRKLSSYIEVRYGSMAKGWGLWSRDLGLMSSAGGQFWFGRSRSMPFILARSLQNRTKTTGGPLCVCTPHMQSKDPPASSQRVGDSGRHGYRAQPEYYGFCCPLERKTLYALKDKTIPDFLHNLHFL